ncbi:hypothetical protein BU25DRAFT_298001, partial [Macroventuria anomochaeta]
FPVDFNQVYHSNVRLNASWLGYRVRHKAQLAGRRETAAIWLYGYWLCRKCHESMTNSDALRIDGTAHIVTHLRNKHQIDPKTGLVLDGKPPPEDPWAAARTAGSSTFTAHTP